MSKTQKQTTAPVPVPVPGPGPVPVPVPVPVPAIPSSTRRRLPDERVSLTHKFSIEGCEGYLHLGFFERPSGLPPYDSTNLGEIFITMAKEGSTLGGLTNTIGILLSMLLQAGVPLLTITSKLRSIRFEPMGWTGNQEIIPHADSLVDYIARYLELRFGLQQPQQPEVKQ